jgi:transcriptional regulator with XRE-family HTH domain
MADQNTGRWAAIRARTVDTPERQARYERTKHQVLAVRKILQQIDAERERRGMTKAALAQCVGMTPSVVRRLFASEASNPNLGTVIAMLDALELDVRVAPQPGRRRVAIPAATRPAHTDSGAGAKRTTRELAKAS